MAYRSLMSRYRDQPSSEVFAHFGYSGHDDETWETPYEKLASLAKPEDWDFHRSEFKRAGQQFPILVGYLNYTFLRAQDQDKIRYSADGDRACFNTGLQTPNEPGIATYIENASDLVFDTRCEIEVNYDHLFNDNRERLPEVLRENRTLAISAIQGAIELLKEKILRNYKLAIPHWCS